MEVLQQYSQTDAKLLRNEERAAILICDNYAHLALCVGCVITYGA